jgi:3-oxoacyl-[acyl-carrier-protein] synthase II
LKGRRVVVTGLGAVTPLGLTVAETWPRILAGESGITGVTCFDPAAFPSKIGGEIKGFDPNRFIPGKDVKKMDPFIHYGIAAAAEALADAGLDLTRVNLDNFGVAIGSGIGGLAGIINGHDAYLQGGPRKISPFFVPANIVNMVAGHVAILHNLRGPNISVVTACTTGTHNIGLAARAIAYGEADLMLAGGAEQALCPMGLGGFGAARALSSRNDAPAQASRPWDLERDGFVLSDGAGVLLLEEQEHAQRRGARIYGELLGFGMSCDAHHMTAPAASGEGAQRCMAAALRDAAINPDAIDYINAHGTSTPAGDKAETLALKAFFGEHAYQVAVSSTKSMIGHQLGAAGGVEAIFCLLALRDQVAPPTINLDNPDPSCDLDYVPHHARQMPLRTVLSNSFGFGGTNGTLVFRQLR